MSMKNIENIKNTIYKNVSIFCFYMFNTRNWKLMSKTEERIELLI